MIIAIIIYITLCAFILAGLYNELNLSPFIKLLLCIITGWFMTPCIIAFILGKYLYHLDVTL